VARSPRTFFADSTYCGEIHETNDVAFGHQLWSVFEPRKRAEGKWMKLPELQKKTTLDKDLSKFVRLEQATAETGQQIVKVGLGILFLAAVWVIATIGYYDGMDAPHGFTMSHTGAC